VKSTLKYIYIFKKVCVVGSDIVIEVGIPYCIKRRYQIFEEFSLRRKKKKKSV
jgi:hypothetical protein